MEKIIVLMSTFNGEKHLREQIDSILAQMDVNVELLVRDDGSSDRTTEILAEYQEAGKLRWYTGENLKPAYSFMDLIQRAGDAPYYALSDQDDYWLPEKLSRAVRMLREAEPSRPALYHSRTILADENLNPINDERKGNQITTVKQALIGSGATGCTMCFNRALLELLRKPHPDFKLMHDNWIYKVCMVTEGSILRGDKPYILYRQHGNNAIGGFSQKQHPFRRHLKSIRGEKCYRSEGIAALYEAYQDDMPEENRKTTELLAYYKKGLNRFRILADEGFETGNRRNDRLFKIAILFGLY